MYELIREDREAFLFLNHLGSKPYDFFWIWLSETWVWIPLYVIFAYLLYKSFGWKKFLFILIFIALGVTVSDQLAGIFKHGIARLRPCNDPSLNQMMRIVKCGGPYGFYSSHASNTFFLAQFLSMLLGQRYRLFPFFIFFWAAVVSYSRIYLGVHFPMDILMGAAAGFLIGGLFATLAIRSIRKISS